MGRAHALAYLYTMFRCITKVLVSFEFRGVTSWYQSFSLNEVSVDIRIPRFKLSKLRITKPTVGKVLGGESIKAYGKSISQNYDGVKRESLCIIYSYIT